MRESLKNLFANLIILEDKNQFHYTVKPYELTNSLGNVVAILQEYTFTKSDSNSGEFLYKLYKTKEGNWYDVEETTIVAGKNILRMLKSAIDTKENNSVLD